MPIETPTGTLEVENAKFRASSVEATIAVGIGTESNDAYPLQIFKETAPDIRLREGSTISSAARFYSNNSNLYIQTGTNFTTGSAGDVAFQTMGGQSTHMVIKSDGNVGIGTASPSSKLHVFGGALSADTDLATFHYTNGNQSYLKIRQVNHTPANANWTGWSTRIQHVTDVTDQSYIEFNPVGGTYATAFGMGGNEYMRIKNGGNVGIGTTSPATKLDILLDSETGSSNTVGLTIRNYSSDHTSIANGFGSRINFVTNRGTSAMYNAPSADIKGYIYSGAGGTGDYHALDLDVYGDNSSLNRGISILSQSSSGGPANTIMHGNVGVAGDLTVDGKIYNYNYTEVDINAPATTSGSWSESSSSSAWGDPKFNSTYDQYRHNDAPGYVEYNIPTGMKSAYISQLQWDNGGYVDIHGVQADGDLVFLRRINTKQNVENSNHGNPDQRDGSTITFVGSGLQYFTKIRLTNKKGRFHLTGLAFTPNENEGTEGTGMVHTAQISDLSGHPVQYVGENVNDIVVYAASMGRFITPLDITITPKFSNSKIMLHWVINCELHHDQVYRVYRGSTLIGYNTNNNSRWSGATPAHYDVDHGSTMNSDTVVWVDTPNTTSAVTYRVYCQSSNGNTQWYALNKTIHGASTGQDNYEIAVSYKSAMEIAV